jgi:hypothetical protein
VRLAQPANLAEDDDLRLVFAHHVGNVVLDGSVARRIISALMVVIVVAVVVATTGTGATSRAWERGAGGWGSRTGRTGGQVARRAENVDQLSGGCSADGSSRGWWSA